MKRIFAILIAATLLPGLAACGGKTLTLVVVRNAAQGVDGCEEYPHAYGGELTVQTIADGLTELTGLYFGALDVSQVDETTLLVSWPADSALFGGGEQEEREEFLFFDYDSMAWFMLDSLYETVRTNMPGVAEIYYAVNGDESLVLENLSPPVDFGFDAPYMTSVAYMDGFGDLIEEDPVDPADVNWWGEYSSEIGMLHIVNYNGRSFRFTFDSDGVTDDGVAALDPETAILASWEKYEFRFNLEQDTITVWYDGGNAVDYMRTEDAAG